MNLLQMSLLELKGKAYDLMVMMQNIKQDMDAINDAIGKKLQEEAKKKLETVKPAPPVKPEPPKVEGKKNEPSSQGKN